MKLSPFTTHDWNAYSGAEPFDDGSDPLISHDALVIDGHDAVIVLDDNGLHIEWTVDDNLFSACVNACDDARALALLRPRMTYAEIEALPGVIIIGH